MPAGFAEVIIVWRECSIQTDRRLQLVEITEQAREAASVSGIRDGICHVFIPHTTAGVTINENADDDVAGDLLRGFEQLVPPGPYRHAEGNSPAHLLATLTGSSVSVPVVAGRLALGTWQGIYFCEFDGPRRRRFLISVSAG
jgi:secondary thiamine-phosphate synthase enzyme